MAGVPSHEPQFNRLCSVVFRDSRFKTSILTERMAPRICSLQQKHRRILSPCFTLNYRIMIQCIIQNHNTKPLQRLHSHDDTTLWHLPFISTWSVQQHKIAGHLANIDSQIGNGIWRVFELFNHRLWSRVCSYCCGWRSCSNFQELYRRLFERYSNTHHPELLQCFTRPLQIQAGWFHSELK